MSGLRIIAGIAKGKRLKTRKTKNLRPATEFIREAFFNIIGPRIIDQTFLDLFAGSGSMGIEALSRGAGEAVFIERDPQTAALIRENLTLVGFQNQGYVYAVDVFKGITHLKREKNQFNFIFVDPPFRKNLVEPTLKIIFKSNILKPGGLVVARSAFNEEFTNIFKPYREEKYGVSILRFFTGGETEMS